MTEKDSARFLSIYNSVKDKSNHLDKAASLMGWDGDDISLIEEDLQQKRLQRMPIPTIFQIYRIRTQTSSIYSH